ncbi:nucleotidyltransferase family protein [Paramagnetospirillum magneticum]|uniref:Nucleoside-diphosphate-sugar pyrophosphorylase n=1 Tax=Paramagnetospirillum magneticum (strain ATCC 700264 / AMB-1) TaxID=342108 RepID=Q2WB86_PARM1|nr:nucleotidyltransferase family protein [Paramagnetospirillum magneticum]BAE48889.1 Nucleoside-diphosphate-sugar pyrophosphorylase [Paramagnetospirillum magneticum AMB-1]
MKRWQDTLVSPTTPVLDAIKALDLGAMQIVLVVDGQSRLLGTITDGDIRRGLLRGLPLESPASEVMNPRFHHGRVEDEAGVLLATMRRLQISQMPLLDGDGRVVGLKTLEQMLALDGCDNWVVLMAGGEGRRLRPLTQDVPKPLLPVGPRPILETILKNFIEAGFRNFFISVNYRAEQVESHFGDGSALGVSIRYLREDRQLGTAGALGLLPGTPSEPLIVMNGDILTTVDFKQLLAFHQEHRAAATMAVREYHFEVPYGVVEVEGTRLKGIEEKPVVRNFVNAGIYVLNPEVLNLVKPGQPHNMPQIYQTLMDGGQDCAVFPIREYWLDIGRLDDFDRANLDFHEVFR